MTKLTTKQIGIGSDTEYDTTLDQIAELTVKRDKLQAKLDKAILDARSEFGDEISNITDRIAAKMAQAETYAVRNRSLLLTGDCKSSETGKAKWGFRMGLPTLVPLSKKFTWKVIVSKITKAGKTHLLKTADPKPDKDRIKADLSDEELAVLGMRVEQTESYWVEPKTDSAEKLVNG